jgi:hypothetical protein
VLGLWCGAAGPLCPAVTALLLQLLCCGCCKCSGLDCSGFESTVKKGVHWLRMVLSARTAAVRLCA